MDGVVGFQKYKDQKKSLPNFLNAEKC